MKKCCASEGPPCTDWERTLQTDGFFFEMSDVKDKCKPKNKRWFFLIAIYTWRKSSFPVVVAAMLELVKLVNWRFEPSQPLEIISVLKEIFKRDIQLKGPIRQRWDQRNRVRIQRVVGRTYGIKYIWKGHKDRNKHKNRIKRSWQARLVLCLWHKL